MSHLRDPAMEIMVDSRLATRVRQPDLPIDLTKQVAVAGQNQRAPTLRRLECIRLPGMDVENQSRGRVGVKTRRQSNFDHVASARQCRIKALRVEKTVRQCA